MYPLVNLTFITYINHLFDMFAECVSVKRCLPPSSPLRELGKNLFFTLGMGTEGGINTTYCYRTSKVTSHSPRPSAKPLHSKGGELFKKLNVSRAFSQPPYIARYPLHTDRQQNTSTSRVGSTLELLIEAESLCLGSITIDKCSSSSSVLPLFPIAACKE